MCIVVRKAIYSHSSKNQDAMKRETRRNSVLALSCLPQTVILLADIYPGPLGVLTISVYFLTLLSLSYTKMCLRYILFCTSLSPLNNTEWGPSHVGLVSLLRESVPVCLQCVLENTQTVSKNNNATCNLICTCLEDKLPEAYYRF